MSLDKVRTDIERIIKRDVHTTEEKIRMLRKMHGDIRAQQRAQTESSMVADADTGTELREVEMALESLGVDPDGPEDSGAATL